ncbi:MAG: zinc ABC transporter substrate-binding protein [Thermoguttaceae bacterium]|nr:zinc ABC transporter substrate-binding protein [Thermoguttaceae bacterium]MDW8079269.1 zinc ABC transporter substrate-binding protein [Thermoguttaceae bacterium]
MHLLRKLAGYVLFALSAPIAKEYFVDIGFVDRFVRDCRSVFLAAARVLIVFLVLHASGGCNPVGKGDPSQRRYPLRVLCTTGMIADAVRAVGGPQVEVEQLLPPGVDPHLYRPSARDKWRINAADVVFFNGLRLEGRLEPLLVRRSRWMPVFAVTDVLRRDCPERLRPLDDNSGILDPHVWLELELWIRCVDFIAECLASVDPAHAASYRQRAQLYQAELRQLDEYARSRLRAIPEERRMLVTTHDAFGYFARRYGLSVATLQGLSTVDEIDLVTMNLLIEELVARRVPAVFVENSVSPRALEAVVAGCRARGHQLKIGGMLYADCLGLPGSPGETFLGAFRHNVDTIAEALR